MLAGLALLAMVSTVFGMMMAVAQDLPALEQAQQYQASQNSVVYDTRGNKIGTLTGEDNRILLESGEISQNVKSAVVAIEDNRFYQHRGVDFEGIGRAVVQDVLALSAEQGASTITQQFVKNALEAQSTRTVFQKLRESALAYHLERRWTKEKILTEYLNSIYFGEGAYGVEAAARTYFGELHPGCGEEGQPACASLLLPDEAAMLAGLISSPSAYSPRANPELALERRNLVLAKMREQGVISDVEAQEAGQRALPAPSQIEPPQEDSISPYFTSWLRQQMVDRYGAGYAFAGGLRIKSTLDLELQQAAENAIVNRLAGIPPTGAAVVIDNKTGGVRAMVGGFDYEHRPFNLATNGHRQPGSAMKPFILATALKSGISPNQTYASQVKEFKVPNSPGEKFVVHNYEDQYAGVASLASATTRSDNSVYAEVGLRLGTKKVAKTAQAMGIETPVSTNPAMVLGGLKEGVTPLEMTHAYETLARDGKRISGSLAASPGGPVAIQEIRGPGGDVIKGGRNKIYSKQVIPKGTASTAVSILRTVVTSGTGKRAQVGEFAWGKTGTTENNGDAWFCGGTEEITACVWVGHADSNSPMETEFAGEPVDGGTFPALIWASIVSAYYSIVEGRSVESAPAAPVAPAPTAPAPEAAPEPAPAPGGNTGGGGGGGGGGQAP